MFTANYAEDLSVSRGLFPEIFNLASKAEIVSNATCGERGPETFCRLAQWIGRGDQCGVCDVRSSDPAKRHHASFALDGTSRWWQSPTLQAGPQYEWITLTIDLKQVCTTTRNVAGYSPYVYILIFKYAPISTC